jgi:[ribosomal protein S5]-alanine N-acetyltransferase
MILRETERLILRNFNSDDLEDMLEITRQYERSEMGKYDQLYPQTAEELKPVIDYLSSGDYFAAVELKSQGKVIGLIQFQLKKDYVNEVVRGFGFNFNANFHGKGYATEACKEALEYLLGELQIDKCTAGTAAVNTRSRKLLDRLGFKEVGEKTTHFREDADGVPIKFLYTLYELTREQWKTKN